MFSWNAAPSYPLFPALSATADRETMRELLRRSPGFGDQMWLQKQLFVLTKVCGVSQPRNHQLKKSHRFFKGSGRKKSGLATVTPSTWTQLQILVRGLLVKQQQETTRSERKPNAQPGCLLCLLWGTAGFKRRLLAGDSLCDLSFGFYYPSY